MAHIQYKRNVTWDSALSDLGFTDVVVSGITQSLVINGNKTTSGAPASTAGYFAPGCLIQNLVTGVMYVNTGSTAAPVWTVIDTASGLALTQNHIFVGNASNLPTDVAMSGDVTIVASGATTIGAGRVSGAKLVTGVGYFTVSTSTNGTTPVNVFGSTTPFSGTITGIYVISKDTTAGNITVADTAGTIATIAKSTTAGVMTGAVSLANTGFLIGNTMTVDSSSAGNADVIIVFTTA